tara:strand:- start:490 stop:681 length:192 start_codon:yes stop_codon:yes gene_type:complete
VGLTVPSCGKHVKLTVACDVPLPEAADRLRGSRIVTDEVHDITHLNPARLNYGGIHTRPHDFH